MVQNVPNNDRKDAASDDAESHLSGLAIFSSGEFATSEFPSIGLSSIRITLDIAVSAFVASPDTGEESTQLFGACASMVGALRTMFRKYEAGLELSSAWAVDMKDPRNDIAHAGARLVTLAAAIQPEVFPSIATIHFYASKDGGVTGQKISLAEKARDRVLDLDYLPAELSEPHSV